jgi:hypothetical protein
MTDKYFNECANANDLRTRYDEIVRMFNLQALPDGGFKTEVEQEFQAKLTSFTSASQNPAGEAEKFTIEQVQKWVSSKNLSAERIGKWIWVSNRGLNGQSLDMKRLGFRFSSSKQYWYWRADEDRSSNPNPLPIETIRKRYGARQIGMNL